MKLALLLSLWSAPGAPSISEAADTAVRLVARELRAPADLALRVQCAPELRGLERLVGGLLVHRLEQLWPEQGAPRRLAGDATWAQARAAGAEWLLTVALERAGTRGLHFRAELERVDGGLWSADEGPITVAGLRLQVGLDDETRAWTEPPRPAPAAGFTEPQPWLELDEPVLDLAACELDPSHPGDELVVLFPERVRVYHLAEGGPSPWILQSLDGPRPAERLRAPRGRLGCQETGSRGPELWLGTSDRERGYRFTIDRLRGALVEAERLPGIPLGFGPEAPPLFATPEPSTGGFRLIESGRSVLDLDRATEPALELVAPGIWRPLGSAPDAPPLARGGLGGTRAAAREPGWVTTSSVAWRGPDHLSLRLRDGTQVGKSLRVHGPVRASTFVEGPSGDGFLLIAVGVAIEGKSTLLRVRLTNPAEGRR